MCSSFDLISYLRLPSVGDRASKELTPDLGIELSSEHRSVKTFDGSLSNSLNTAKIGALTN